MARSDAWRKLPRRVLDRLRTDNLWLRMLKYGLALTVTLSVAILPAVIEKFGLSTFFMPLQTMFAHPAQRLGSMIETQMLIVSGAILGTAWGSLGLYLSSLIVGTNEDAAYGIRAVFLFLAIIIHGYLRSSSPKLFAQLYFFLMTSFMILVGSSTHLTSYAVTSILYPTLAANGILLVIGLSLFPQYSGSFLGTSTISILSESVDTLSQATAWFMAEEGDLEPSLTYQLTRPGTGLSLARLKTRRATAEAGWFAGFHSKFRAVFWNPLKRVGSGKTPNDSVDAEQESPLLSLTSAKPALRARLRKCKAAQREVNFEMSLSALPLDILRPISTEGMANLVRDIITVIGACENKLLMIGDDSDDEELSTLHPQSRPTTRAGEDQDDHLDPTATSPRGKRPAMPPRTKSTPKEEFLEKLKLIKPSREMEEGDAELLKSILDRIRDPVKDFDNAIKQAVSFLISCLAYCYDVPKLPSGATAPTGVLLEEIDLRIDSFEEALANFDVDSMDEFKQLLATKGDDESEAEVDILPRFETFLVSSFLLGLRQAAMHILQMLKHMRLLVEARQARNDRARIYWPHYTSLREWLSVGGDADGMVLPQKARKPARSGAEEADDEPQDFDADLILIKTRSGSKSARPDVEAGTHFQTENGTLQEKKGPSKGKKPKARGGPEAPSSWFMRLRGRMADTIEWIQGSDDVEYAMKLTVAVALVTWPGLMPRWHDWYYSVRGIWAPLQLVLVFEVAIGTSLFIFFIRLFGVIFGCTVGLAAHEVGDGNRVVAVVIIVIAALPCIFVQLETKYAKAGVVAMTTMMVVSLGALNGTGKVIENFYFRLIAFLVGGTTAVLIELTLYPVRARDRLIESVSSTVREVATMQAALAIGVDSPTTLSLHSPQLYKRFARSRNKAQSALTAAETFLPFCLSEPRLKGNFKVLVPVYDEIIFVLHQIIDRMDTVLSLRDNYGSSVLEDLNPLVYAYRRNVAGGMALSLFAVDEAMTTRFPLPQFLPSSRTAQLRLINRVRQLTARNPHHQADPSSSRHPRHDSPGPFSFGRRGADRLGVPGVRSPRASLEVADAVDDAASLMSAVQIAERHKVLAWNASTAGQVEIIEYLEELVELAKLIVGVNAFRSGMLRSLDFGDDDEGERLVGAVSAYPSEDGDGGGLSATRRGAGRPGDWSAEGPGPGPYGIRRVATHAGFEGGVGMAEAEVGDALPVSLQRVGSRLWRDAGVRRRRMSVMGRGKGKSFDEV